MAASGRHFPPDTYVPVLEGERAELDALAETRSEGLVPLLEFTGSSTVLPALERAWRGTDGVVWVHVQDPGGAAPEDRAADVDDAFRGLRRAGIVAVPVLALHEPPALVAAVAAIDRTDRRGVVLRVDVDEFFDTDADTVSAVGAMLADLGLGADAVDLVLDGGFLEGPPERRAQDALDALESLRSHPWRNVVLAFSAFPRALDEVVSRNSVTAVPRHDATAFTIAAIRSRHDLVYGDYGVGNAAYAAASSPVPDIRYAADEYWYVHRGDRRGAPSAQYRRLARELVAAPHYAGPSSSPGDRWIDDAASGADGPGNAVTHLRAATSRHLHLVLQRLATLHVP